MNPAPPAISLAAKTAAAAQLLRAAATELAPAAFSTSLGAEDMVLMDIIVRENLPIEIFSIDTGRLPPETLDLLGRAEKHYGRIFKLYFPDHAAVEAYVAQHGINAFYESVDLRKACCHARKVEPLQRALAGKNGWITGLRAEQSPTRSALQEMERDENFNLVKVNPLVGWTEAEIRDYLKSRNVPYNALHDRGYPSIGCAPCTRAVAPGEDIRAGRWWWEAPQQKECGLHVGPDGRLTRAKPV